MARAKAVLAVAAVVLALAGGRPAAAGPYFRPGLNEVKLGGFQDLSGSGGLTEGVVVPVIVHRAADGFLFIPGVTWDLLDVGYSRSELTGPALRLGPSVNLDEPVKAAVRFACRALPGWAADDRYRFLKAAFAPAGADTPAVLALGPSFRLAAPTWDTNTWRGGWDFAFTLAHRF